VVDETLAFQWECEKLESTPSVWMKNMTISYSFAGLRPVRCRSSIRILPMLLEVLNPLLYACAKGHARRATRLIRKGANLEACLADGSTAIWHAVWGDQLQCVRVLIEAGANLDAKDEKGRTPIMLAVEYGYVESVRALLDAGADLDSRGINGEDATAIARGWGMNELAELIESVRAARAEKLAISAVAPAKQSFARRVCSL
jgi:hypothetical protein